MTVEPNPETLFSYAEVAEVLGGLDEVQRNAILGRLATTASAKEAKTQSEEVTEAAVNLVNTYELWQIHGGDELDMVVGAAEDALNLVDRGNFDLADDTVKKTVFFSASIVFAQESWSDFYYWTTDDGQDDGSTDDQDGDTSQQGYDKLVERVGISEEMLLDYFRDGLVRLEDDDTDQKRDVIEREYSALTSFENLFQHEGPLWNETILPLATELRTHLLQLGVEIPGYSEEDLEEFRDMRRSYERIGAAVPEALRKVTDGE